MPIPLVFANSLSVPAISAPMFLVSGPRLVVETCRAGVLGTFPALNQRTTSGFRDWLQEIREDLARYERAAPFGVNLVVHRSNARLEADLATVVEERVPVVITSLGAVDEVVQAVQSYGGLVFHDVTNLRHAVKAQEAGVDGVIAVCSGAGGHASTLSAFALLPEICREFEGTLILGGCVSTGAHIAAARMLGADMAYIGTRFLASAESLAPDAYKRMVIDSGSADIVYTPKISGVPGNFLRESIRAAGLDPDDLTPRASYNFGASGDGAEVKAWKEVWASGQGVGSISDAPSVAELCARLAQEYREAIGQVAGW